MAVTSHTSASAHRSGASRVDASESVISEDEAPGAEALDVDAADLYARFFRALGDPTRVRLLRLLLDAPTGERSVNDLIAAVGAPQSRVSTHLGCLRWCGLVQTRREGKQVYYRVADPRVRELLTVAGAMLRDHAAGVASCAVVG
ncbi:MAG TPA: metalloregulator ArsR/SmtB family transcription factor [Ktedonobacterales bacterium]|nr:metalloregulator ArsR/SmtB family transcription factor [Ktedonobacterales bacterium]